jgi:hypothetical protein
MCWFSTKLIFSLSYQKVTWSRHDIAKKKYSLGAKQQSHTHRYGLEFYCNVTL